jgi:hypothetical protein
MPETKGRTIEEIIDEFNGGSRRRGYKRNEHIAMENPNAWSLSHFFFNEWQTEVEVHRW